MAQRKLGQRLQVWLLFTADDGDEPQLAFWIKRYLLIYMTSPSMSDIFWFTEHNGSDLW
jgi:hypothetical protein